MYYITYSSLILFQVSKRDTLSQYLEIQAERQLVQELLSHQESVKAYVRRKLRKQDKVLNNQHDFLNFQQKKFKRAQMEQNTPLFELNKRLEKISRGIHEMTAAP